MALPLVYTSQTIRYEPIDEALDWPQFEWLNEPPREWGEAISLDGVIFMDQHIRPFIVREATRNHPTATYGLTLVVAAQRPGLVRVYMQFFDPVTGAFITKYSGAKIPNLETVHLAAARDGSVWASILPDTVEKIHVNLDGWESTGVEYHPAGFTPQASVVACVDENADLYICRAGVTPDVDVYRLSTGVRLYSITVGCPVTSLMLEDERRCYAICDDGIFVLIDYVAARVLGVIRLDLTEDQTIEQVGFGWDPFGRRIISAEKTPDELVTGAPTTVLRGYYPIPKAVRLTTPIPLAVPRAGRRVRFLTRCHGTTGEPIGGKTITATETGNGTLRARTASTDAEGYATHHLVCDNSGTSTIEVTAETE